MTIRLVPRAALVTLLLAACTDSKPSGAPIPIILTTIDTLLRPDNAVLQHPTDLALDPEGRLIIADSGSGAIVVLDPATGAHHAIAGAGTPAGALNNPGGLLLSGDTLWVVERGARRLQALTREGKPLLARPLPADGEVSVGPSGAVIVALDGREDALARRIGADGSPAGTLGKPVVPGIAGDNPAALRADIQARKIPADLRNLTLPLATTDGGVWLSLSTEGRLDRYDAHDSLVFTYPLLAPERGAIVADFFDANRAGHDSAGYLPLSYIVTGRTVGTEYWFLLRMPRGTGTVILAHELNGPLRRRVLVPASTGIRSFAVDQARRALYLLDPLEGTLLRVPIPAEVEITGRPRLPG